MLDLMRRKAQSPYLQATVVIIILVFIFWGVGSNQGNSPNVVATVNDEPISLESYQQVYNQLLTQFSQQFGGTIPEGLLKNFGLKDQALNQLVQRVLINQEAQKIGIYVSIDEVRRNIEGIESFKENGVFNIDNYHQILAASRLTVTDFEAGVRSDLLTKKVVAALSNFGRIAANELEDRFRYDYEEIKLQYAAFKGEDFRNKVEVTDEELTTYFAEHQQEYKTPVQIKLQYLTFLAEDIAAGQEITEAEIAAYYQGNLNLYTEPERRQARHILIKTTEQDNTGTRAEKRQQIDDLLAKIKKGEDFAKLAKNYSEDSGSAAKGGSLGIFARGQMVKPFEDAAFAMEEGDVSEVIETQFGYHVVTVEKILPASVRSVEEVKKEIDSRLRQEKGKTATFTLANEAYEKIILAGSLVKYAEAGAVKISSTGYFPKSSPPDGVMSTPQFLNAAFQLKKGELSSLVELAGGYAIIFAEDTKEPEIPPLADVRDKVKEDYIKAQAIQLAEQAAQKMLDQVKGGDDFAQTAREYKAGVTESDFFSRSKKFSPDLPAQVIEKSLQLSASAPYPDGVVSENNMSYVFRFKENKATDEDSFEREKDEFRKRQLAEKNGLLFDAWLAALKKNAEIVTTEQYL